MIALLPEEHLFGFDRLPFEEQKWRARVFLMIYTNTGGIAFSWWQAMREDPEDPDDAKVKALVATVDDREIAFRVAEAARGRWYGPPEDELGDV
jgi:hypothetical protein